MLRSTTIASGTTHWYVMMKSTDNFGSKVKFPFLKKSTDVIFKQKLYILTLYVFMSCSNSFARKLWISITTDYLSSCITYLKIIMNKYELIDLFVQIVRRNIFQCADKICLIKPFSSRKVIVSSKIIERSFITPRPKLSRLVLSNFVTGFCFSNFFGGMLKSGLRLFIASNISSHAHDWLTPK